VKKLDYQWMRDLIAADRTRRKLRKMRKSDIQSNLYDIPAVHRELQDISEHNPAMGKMFWQKLVPLMIGEELARPTYSVYYPNSDKVFVKIRMYPAFMWGGDWHYQHRWGMEAAEAEQVYYTRQKNRQAVGRHEHFEEMFMNFLKDNGGTGQNILMDEVMSDLLRKHPEYDLVN